MTDKPAEPAAEPDDDVKPVAGGAESISDAASTAAAATAETGSADSGETVSQESAAAPTVSMHKVSRAEVPSGADSGPGRSLPRALLAALAVTVLLLVGAVGAAGYLFVQERDQAERLNAYDEARQAACGYAPVLANYDAKNLDPYFSAVLAGATGDWKKEFETTTTELRDALVAGQVVSNAGDIQCAVKTADATSAEIVVVIGQTITSLGTQGQPAPGQLAMVMRMQKIDGRWLVGQMASPLATPLP